MRQDQRHRTQWAAQFAVASELCKRDYEVAFTMGSNTPLADLMVVSPRQTAFLIDVKGMRRRDFWLIRKHAHRPDLFFVFVHVQIEKPNDFFVMPHSDVIAAMAEYETIAKKHDPRFDGFRWKAVLSFRDRWDLLPG
jgi:hypothetical protein